MEMILEIKIMLSGIKLVKLWNIASSAAPSTADGTALGTG